MTGDHSPVPDLLHELRRQFAEGRVERVVELRRLLARAASPDETSALTDLRGAFHRLAGSAGVFGFTESGRLAKSAETLLDAALREPNPNIPEGLAEMLERLTRMLEQEAACLDRPEIGGADAGAEPGAAFCRLFRRGRACVVAERRSEMVEGLERELDSAGFSAQWVRPADAATACSGAAVALVGTEAGGDGYEAARQIANVPNGPFLRVLFTEGTDSVDLLRLGPSRVHRVIHRVFELRSVVRPDPSEGEVLKAKILSVEDDPDCAGAIGAMLAAAGHTMRVVSGPARLLEEMSEFRPDLLLLDWDLPQVSGYDLTRIVRSDARHELLPIVFVTARAEGADRRAALRAGADDFLVKPFTTEELVETVEIQLRKHRALRRRLDADVLTELLNRSATLAAAEDLVQSALERGECALVAILDIDHFKRVNDELGHAVGDRVLRELATHLLAHQRAGDVVGRLGGEELLLAMTGTDKGALALRLDGVRASLRIDLRGVDGRYLRSVTFSAGAAIAPEHGTDLGHLLKLADVALYEAKALGRNRVVLVRER